MSLIKNNHNVYILGAGFSKPASMPLVSDFLNKMREALDYYFSKDDKREIEAIEAVLRFRQDASSSAYRINIDIENIEHLFSLASAIDSKNLNSHMKNSIAATLNYCHIKSTSKRHWALNPDDPTNFKLSHLQEFSDETGPAYWVNDTEYALLNLLDYLHPYYISDDNTIITFNYDLVVEECLQCLRVPYNYSLSYVSLDDASSATKNDGLKLLKLHGSINWSYPGSAGTNLNIYPGYDSAKRNNYFLLVPPTWQKQFDSIIAQIWEKSIGALSIATRIIIIGFSIPETDAHFKYLISAGLKDNISLREIVFVNISDKNVFQDRFRDMFQPNFQEKFFRYIQSGVTEFASDIGMLRSVGRRL